MGYGYEYDYGRICYAQHFYNNNNSIELRSSISAHYTHTHLHFRYLSFVADSAWKDWVKKYFLLHSSLIWMAARV